MSLRTKLALMCLAMMCVFLGLLRVIFQLQIPSGSSRGLPRQYSPSLQWTIMVFVIVTFVLVLYVSVTIIRRIRAMERHAQQIAHGDLSVTLPVKGGDELSALATTLNYLSSQLRQQEELRKRMTQDIAHDLRTPLATLKSHMEAFIDGVWDPSPERLKSCVEEIDRFQSLVRAVEVLHETDNNQANTPRTAIDLRTIVRTVIGIAESRCRNGDLALSLQECEHPAWVTAHADHLSQIAWNLLDNAVKYTPPGGAIQVCVDCTDGLTLLKVDDTGIGIPEQDISHIFERFYRVDRSRSRKTGGSGLGLAIVKQLVQFSKGTIQVASQEDSGTSVVVTWETGRPTIPDLETTSAPA